MSSNEVKVGALTLAGAAILAGIISFMGAWHFGSSGYKLKISYPQVSGLVEGQAVRYAGVQIGTVEAISILPDCVQVTAAIDEKIKIPQGAVFTISSDGIMGEKFVHILPPAKVASNYIAPGSEVLGVPGAGMEDFFAASGDVMNKLDKIVAAFDGIFGDEKVQQSLREGVLAMSEVSRHMNTFSQVIADVAVENRQQMKLMLREMSELTRRMNGIAGHLESIAANADNDGATGRNLAQVAERLAESSTRIDNIIKLFENVASDPSTEENLKQTLENATQASARANKILGTLSTAKITVDAGHNLRGDNWRGNLGVAFQPTERNYLYVGAYDLGDSNKLDLSVGQKLGGAALSVGAMQGEFGVGLSLDFGKAFRAYGQLYDFDDAKLRVGGEVQLAPGLVFYGENMDVRNGSKRETYVGLRSRF